MLLVCKIFKWSTPNIITETVLITTYLKMKNCYEIGLLNVKKIRREMKILF